MLMMPTLQRQGARRLLVLACVLMAVSGSKAATTEEDPQTKAEQVDEAAAPSAEAAVPAKGAPVVLEEGCPPIYGCAPRASSHQRSRTKDRSLRRSNPRSSSVPPLPYRPRQLSAISARLPWLSWCSNFRATADCCAPPGFRVAPGALVAADRALLTCLNSLCKSNVGAKDSGV